MRNPGVPFIRPLIAVVAASLCACGARTLRASAVTLIDNGRTGHTIIISKTAIRPEQHAADELQRFLHEISGVRPAIATDDQPVEGKRICVGQSTCVAKLAPEIDIRSLGQEGYHIKTVGDDLIIVGGRPRGTLYGVYTLLEDELGCRWFTPDCSRIPKNPRIIIKPMDRRYVPPLEYRATDYPNSRDGDWAVRNKQNGTLTGIDESRGGKISYAYFVHTFNALIPPEKYFSTHPEWFSMIGGKRIKDHSQLCLTNVEMLKVAKATVRQWIKGNPQATLFSVSQNDWHNYCTCPDCHALAQREEAQSGPLLAFVNAIAEDIERDYPDKIIDTLAYQYTRKPPKTIKPRPNVTVRLCSIECCFIHPLGEDEFNKSFVRDIQGWATICKRLSIWDYVINYAHTIMPFPNLYVLKPNINFFIANGATSIYEEADYYTKGGEMAELRTWIMAKTLWDPTYDTDKAIDEFCEAYYGPAGKFIRAYVTLLHDQVRNAKYHITIYSPPTVPHLRNEVLAKAHTLFDEAEQAVKDDATLLHRVQVARLPILYVQIARAPKAPATTQAGPAPAGESWNIQEWVDRFERIARKEGVSHISEGRSFDDWLKAVRAEHKLPWPGGSR